MKRTFFAIFAIILLFVFFVSAAVRALTIDADLLPGVPSSPTDTNDAGLGDTARRWQSINNLIHFQGNNVGIGTVSPNTTLTVDGILRLNTTDPEPTCTGELRGTFWVIHAGTSTRDSVQVCLRDASGVSSWQNLVN